MMSFKFKVSFLSLSRSLSLSLSKGEVCFLMVYVKSPSALKRKEVPRMLRMLADDDHQEMGL